MLSVNWHIYREMHERSRFDRKSGWLGLGSICARREIVGGRMREWAASERARVNHA